MNFAIATVCLSGTLGEKLEAIAAAGFKGVEILEADLLSHHGTPADVRRMAADLGLNIVTLQPFRDFEGLTGERRERALQRAERKFDTMQELGTDLLMLCSSVAPESLGGIDRAAADLAELGERAGKRGLRIGFEALSWGRHIHDYRDAWEVVRRSGRANFGLVLDSFHTLARGTEIGSIRSVPGDRIFLVQLADAPRLQLDYLSWSRHFRCLPGQGDLDVAGFVEALATTGYAGPVSLEIFNDQFRAGSARMVATDGHRSLIHLFDRTGLPQPDAPTETLPPRATCLGTAFVEFAMDDAGAAAIAPMLAGLGFRQSGRHRSKSVERWSQGDINLVLNTEKEGFAHSYFITHGTSVCAFALKVADAGATFRRAERLLDTPFRQAVGPGELEIPAVRGLGGSLIYFTDPTSELARNWDIDFLPVEGADAGPDAGLTGIDHLSQSMHYEEMLSWVLFYTSLFDLRKTGVENVVDPGGLVKSQVVEAADGALRIVLNASQSSRTLSARFLSEAFGSGVQHIALATDDLFETIRRIRAAGIETLPIPENYYDDLEGRGDLPLETVDRLRAEGILYDRDANGDFFHVYTKSFEERFFFEIVQRRGGYAGFGAVNAPVRLAAQARLRPPPGW